MAFPYAIRDFKGIFAPVLSIEIFTVQAPVFEKPERRTPGSPAVHLLQYSIELFKSTNLC
jgi:hypothetical protein